MKNIRLLLTGAGRGIGEQIALSLANIGIEVVICARSSDELLRVVEKSSGMSGKLTPIVCDISNSQDVEKMISKAIDVMGGIDVLINNAAIPGPVAILENTDLSAWKETIDVNLIGTVNCCHAVLAAMKEIGGGQIINFLGAGVGWQGFQSGKTAYITSKFAIAGFTEALASEVKEEGIWVNSISPGTADTVLRTVLNPNTPMTEKDSTDQVVALVKFLIFNYSLSFTGKMFSARWDELDILQEQSDRLCNSNSLTLRKIDDRNYLERR